MAEPHISQSPKQITLYLNAMSRSKSHDYNAFANV